MKKLVCIGLATGLIAMAGTAGAQIDPLQVRSWAAACANCHGTNGRAQPGNEPLAGGNKDELLKKLKDFKSGAKPATIMHQLSKGYTDDQMEAIVGWFAAQPK